MGFQRGLLLLAFFAVLSLARTAVTHGRMLGSGTYKNSYFHVAAHYGDVESLQHLLATDADAGKNVNRRGQLGASPLLMAAQNGHLDVVRTLVDVGASVDQPREDGGSPLFVAAASGHLGVVRVSGGWGRELTTLQVAALGPHPQPPLTHGPATHLAPTPHPHHLTPPPNCGPCLSKALLDAGAALEQVDEFGTTALIAAAAYGHPETLRALVDAGGRLDAAMRNGASSLLMASMNGYVEIVRYGPSGGARAPPPTTTHPRTRHPPGTHTSPPPPHPHHPIVALA